MKKVVVAVASCIAVLMASGTASAKGKVGKLGIDTALVIPMGDWSDSAGAGVGALIAGRYHFTPNWAVTGRVGYVGHFSKDIGGLASVSTAELPILVGINYYFAGYEGFYFGAETFLLNLTYKIEADVQFQDEEEYSSFSISDSHSGLRIPLTIGVGWEFSNVDIRGSLFVPNFLLNESGEKMLAGLMFSVGYRFFRF